VEADIDSILERSVKKVTYSTGGESGDVTTSLNSSFSKASFVGMNR